MHGNESMLQDISTEVELTRHLIGRDRLSDDVMAAMQRVPRHEFVGPDMRRHAYINGPLPIGHDMRRHAYVNGHCRSAMGRRFHSLISWH